MLLALDVGNSQIHGGVFDGDKLLLQFRKTTQPVGSSDELGIFLRAGTRASRTAKLPRVEIARPESALGRTSAESIQSGLYHGHVGAIRNLIAALTVEAFSGQRPQVIGTGGFARMFEAEDLFDEI